MPHAVEPVNKAREETILLFGPHVVTFTKKSMEKLIRPALEGPHRDWVLETVSGLPSYWDVLIDKFPEIAGAVPGARQLADLDSWLRQGLNGKDDDEIMPSTMTGPLVVLVQLHQYWRYLELTRGKEGGDKAIADLQADLVAQHKNGQPVEVLGFCFGLLAALAVASSSTQRDFEKYAAVSMRLGMLVGALVDATEEWDKRRGKGASVSYAAAWRGPKQAEDMMRIIKDQAPDAFVAVLYDEARATVTTSERTAPALLKRLRAAGVTAAEIGIKGQLHSPAANRARYTNALVDMCRSLPGVQYPNPDNLALPTYDNQAGGKPVSAELGSLTTMVLRAILVDQCMWYGTFSKVVADKDPFVVTFGLERCVPPTLMRRLGPRQVHFEDMAKDAPQNASSVLHSLGTSDGDIPVPVQQQQQPPQAQPQQQQQQDVAASAAKAPLATSPGKGDDDTIAIVSMSVKTAGADDIHEFVEMLKTGKSQHQAITRDRLVHDLAFREPADKDPKRQWYGNFMRDIDAFDHKFFKKSPRESAAMDPQSRLCLQAAYQCMEQAGYFADANTETHYPDGRDKRHVGVYLGSCGVDYEHNITCHEASAFTATGGLKSFIVGRLSHYFGWTGPSLSYDTACSSSFVALHTACRNILSGECTSALAGGSNTMTNILWFQNLAAGGFVSPTGQCKPFDEAADGYCRSEGIALFYLKKLSDAKRDGNPIIATIASSAVYQNLNHTPLFVPNSPSLSQLFTDVMNTAKVDPRDISLVEAHGTGTPVGDPAEYESVRRAIAGPRRTTPLPIGSVKGHIGHTEGASGAIALAKVVMMMHDSFIPPQASFNKMNSHIDVRPDDHIEVVTSLREWKDERKIALINNYGACGSNSSMVVAQNPLSWALPTGGKSSAVVTLEGRNLPFWIPGYDARSIRAYSAKLVSYLRSTPEAQNKDLTLADISYNLARQTNRGLPQNLIFSCRSVEELQEKLNQVAASSTKDGSEVGIAPAKAERPIVLCFGGQVSTFVGLDRALYEGVALLREHLDACDAVVKSLGFGSIYPDIFSREPIRDTVKLQTMLFATQYASAKSWMDCGLAKKVVAVVGHSFGEITALCVSGVLSLEDTVKLVAGRATLVRDAWGADAGAMIAVEADEALARELVAAANSRLSTSDAPANIACFNGPRSFTLAGSTKAVDAVQATLQSDAKFAGLKSKRLNVTNAFHSALVEPLIDGLAKVGKSVTFNEPAIPLERATELPLAKDAKLDFTFVPEHMRQPVFFNHAVQRLAQQHPQAVFLEAGSNSTITVMASRALAQTTPSPEGLHFQAVSITNTDKGIEGLTDATVALWRQGVRVSFWAHHIVQKKDHIQLLLPPYQFDLSGHHWLPMKSPVEIINKAAMKLIESGAVPGAAPVAKPTVSEEDDPRTQDFVTFIGRQTNGTARFRVNTGSDKYKSLVATHVIAETAPICPAGLLVGIAIDAMFKLCPAWKDEGLQPSVQDVVNHLAICMDPSRTVYLDLAPIGKVKDERKHMLWSLCFLSVVKGTEGPSQTHAEGRMQMRNPLDPLYRQEFNRFERAVDHKRCMQLLSHGMDDDGVDGVEVLQGRNVYRAFTHVVDYGLVYQGVKRVVGRQGENAGVVHKRHEDKDAWMDVPLADCFGQVAGMYVNMMTDVPASDVFIATGCELSMRSPKFQSYRTAPGAAAGVWHVFCRHTRQSDKAYLTDVFVFDPVSGQLAEIMLGLQYGRVARASMSKMLQRLTTDESVLRIKPSTSGPMARKPAAAKPAAAAIPAPAPVAAKAKSAGKKKVKAEKPKKQAKVKASSGNRDIADEVRKVVSEVTGIDTADMKLDAELADLGIDSLMGMELGREIEGYFKCTLDPTEQMEATTVGKFITCVNNALSSAGGAPATQPDSEEDDSEEDESEEEEEEEERAPVPAPVKAKTGSKKAKAEKPKKAAKASSGRRDIAEEVRNVVSEVTGIDTADMKLDAELADLGIDSLMGMELGREIESYFKCTLDPTEQMEATTVGKFITCVNNAMFGAGGAAAAEPEAEDDEDDSSSDAGGYTSSEHSQDGASTATSGPEDEDKSEPNAKAKAHHGKSNNDAPPVASALTLSQSDVLESFGAVKLLSDKSLREHGLNNIERDGVAGINRLCTALIVEAFDELGSPLRAAKPRQVLERVASSTKSAGLISFIYRFLEKDARLIDVDVASGKMTRTYIAVPRKTSDALLQEVLAAHPELAPVSRLTHYTGKHLAGLLRGKVDGSKVLESAEGRALVEALYSEYAFNRMNYEQMRDIIGRLAERIRSHGKIETLRVLEMAAGTGGATKVLAPFLASLGVPVEYTFTDLSPSVVSDAKRTFGKQYPFMRFAVHDMEKAPSAELTGQHVVIASNTMHATRSLVDLAVGLHKALRSDGFLLLLEMTEPLPFADLIFGMGEDWWRPTDGRPHAIVPAERWERDLHAAGFGHVDWTDGTLPENSYQRVILALASGQQGERLPLPVTVQELGYGAAVLEAEGEQLVVKFTAGWDTPELQQLDAQVQSKNSAAKTTYTGAVVIVTGATGSLGSHAVQVLAENPAVATVVCLNRRSSKPVEQRQQAAFTSRGITLSPAAQSKLRVLASDTAQPRLGLPTEEYDWLVGHVTDMMHNAWPMSGTRPMAAFAPQFQTMRNMLDLAREIVLARDINSRPVGFQFVSSIGAIGLAGVQSVKETRYPLTATLPGGYAQGKWVCERMLEATLRQHPRLFRAMSVRPGQIAGSTVSGVWNPVEHLCFIVKSAQHLRAWPDLAGVLHWVPVDHSAAAMAELLKIGGGGGGGGGGGDSVSDAYPIYHIDNPVGQPWKPMNAAIAAALDIPTSEIIPFEKWVQRLRRSPLHPDAENPAVRLGEFLFEHFERMACGGVILDTARSEEHSPTLAREGPVSEELVKKFVKVWKDVGFLSP